MATTLDDVKSKNFEPSAVTSMKNGADIRLAVDNVEDLFRLPDLTHMVIVAGDSDYIAVAQRCKQLGRYVVGMRRVRRL